MNGSEAGGDFVLIKISLLLCVNQVVLMLTSFNLYEKSREVFIKERSPLVSLAVIGQVSKHTTVKWPFALLHDKRKKE